ncbi:RrF2 family transcriptional regulator [Candidatus Omnitrophota bacterium]
MMKLVTRDTDYALRALCCMAVNKEKIFTVSQLVSKLKIPRPFLRKILQALDKKRILKSYKGRSGGFELAQPAERIFLLDLMKIFQGPLRINECLFKGDICPEIKRCPLKKQVDKIERGVLSELKDISVASLLK